jgi:hypothetical protein
MKPNETNQPANEDVIDTGVPDLPDVADDDIDPLTREDIEEDPGEATRKLPKNDHAL